MTDQAKCPHCGSNGDKFGSGILFDCGSANEHQSDLCEVRELRAKVAAQQELLQEAAVVISEAVFVLEWGEDWASDKVKKLEPLHRKIQATL